MSASITKVPVHLTQSAESAPMTCHASMQIGTSKPSVNWPRYAPSAPLTAGHRRVHVARLPSIVVHYQGSESKAASTTGGSTAEVGKRATPVGVPAIVSLEEATVEEASSALC
jgi:hypothetical protein